MAVRADAADRLGQHERALDGILRVEPQHVVPPLREQQLGRLHQRGDLDGPARVHKSCRVRRGGRDVYGEPVEEGDGPGGRR